MKRLRITVEGVAYDVTVEELDAGPGDSRPAPAPVARPAAPRPVAAPPVAAAPVAAAPAGPGDVPSPLAGTVDSVEVSLGQSVAPGDTLLILEAMKMKTPIGAPRAGTVSAINISAGAAVTEGQALITLS